MRICAYRGYASRTHVFVSGRVLANSVPEASHGGESLWQNLVDAYHRFGTDEVPDVPVTVRFEDAEYTAHTDSEDTTTSSCRAAATAVP
jgi:phosphatidate phosphatase APP1